MDSNIFFVVFLCLILLVSALILISFSTSLILICSSFPSLLRWTLRALIQVLSSFLIASFDAVNVSPKTLMIGCMFIYFKMLSNFPFDFFLKVWIIQKFFYFISKELGIFQEIFLLLISNSITL